jgi:nitrite reductase/ring-hydroxylating ferredoxin subunit
MSETTTSTSGTQVKPEMRGVAEILRGDPDIPPASLFEQSPYQGALKEYDKRRYYDRGWHDREVSLVWRRVWQMACREEEIAEAGDFLVYDIADNSILIVRSAAGEINAFYNSCLHRGSQLQPSGSSGSVAKLTCPYHGWTYDLDGRLAAVPCRWDFPQVADAAALAPVRVGIWGGFVFINMDPDCPPLRDYLGVLPDHFGIWALEKRRIGAHVAKVIECNWKVGLEAFLEGYHVANVHPQGMKFTGDVNGQLDTWGPHISRMISALATPSPRLPQGTVSEQDIVEEMRGFLAGDVGSMVVERGGSARSVMAAALKRALTQATGVEHGDFSTSEVLDAVNYLVFPNFMPWAGYGTPIVYRLRPFGNDPDRAILDVYLLYVVPDGTPAPELCETRWLKSGESWTTATELGGLGNIFDQDEQNFLQIQRGLKAGGKPGVTLAAYQESRIRHLHDTLDRYLEG